MGMLFLYFLSILCLKEQLLHCCCAWPLRQGGGADWCLPKCLCGQPLANQCRCVCMQWCWGRGLEAPVHDNWYIPHHVGCCREYDGLWPRKLDPEQGSDLLSVAAVGTADAQLLRSVHSVMLVSDFLDLLSFTVKHCGCPLGVPSCAKD